jgi:hypothetical protein
MKESVADKRARMEPKASQGSERLMTALRLSSFAISDSFSSQTNHGKNAAKQALALNQNRGIGSRVLAKEAPLSMTVATRPNQAATKTEAIDKIWLVKRPGLYRSTAIPTAKQNIVGIRITLIIWGIS